MRRIAFNVLEGQFDLVDDIDFFQSRILDSVLIELDYTTAPQSPASRILTDEDNLIYDEIKI